MELRTVGPECAVWRIGFGKICGWRIFLTKKGLDKNNLRTCDAAEEEAPGIVKNGRFQVSKRVSIGGNYRDTRGAYGL